MSCVSWGRQSILQGLRRGGSAVRILDLYAGAGGERRRAGIEARGHTYVTVDLDPRFGSSVTADMLAIAIDPPGFMYHNGYFDLIWASPPCEAFSVASIGHHWTGGKGAYVPKTVEARLSQELVQATLRFIQWMEPRGWIMENPRGVLRKLPCVQGVPLHTVTYCRYGDTSMKPTDLWGNVPGWIPRPMCHNGHPDHDAAPRGARTGTQGKGGAAERAVVPWQLWADIIYAMEESL